MFFNEFKSLLVIVFREIYKYVFIRLLFLLVTMEKIRIKIGEGLIVVFFVFVRKR